MKHDHNTISLKTRLYGIALCMVLIAGIMINLISCQPAVSQAPVICDCPEIDTQRLFAELETLSLEKEKHFTPVAVYKNCPQGTAYDSVKENNSYLSAQLQLSQRTVKKLNYRLLYALMELDSMKRIVNQ